MRFSRIALIALSLLLIAATLWWFRPWSPWSPSIATKLLHPEHRVENFRSMERVFPYVTLHAPEQSEPLPRAAGDLPTHFDYDGKRIATDEFLARSESTGLMVLHRGVIRGEHYWQGTQPDSRLTSWSMAKTVVASLVAIAREQGHIRSLDDRVGDYISELDDQAWGEVSIRHLLRMSSAIDFGEIYDQRFSDINMLFYRVFLLGTPLHRALDGLPAAGEAGQAFHYISPNSQILGWVLSEAVGEPLYQYAERELWQPLGMQDDAIWNTDSNGTELAFCCLNASLRDYARLGQLYLQQGRWDGQQILPEGWVEKATRLHNWPANEPYRWRGYGYHLWIPEDADGEYFFNGVWGQTIWISEPHEVVIVKTSVDPDFLPNVGEMIAFMRAVSEHVSGQ